MGSFDPFSILRKLAEVYCLLKDADSSLHQRAAMEDSHTDTCNRETISFTSDSQSGTGTPCFSFAARAAGRGRRGPQAEPDRGLLVPGNSWATPQDTAHGLLVAENGFSARPTLSGLGWAVL